MDDNNLLISQYIYKIIDVELHLANTIIHKKHLSNATIIK